MVAMSTPAQVKKRFNMAGLLLIGFIAVYPLFVNPFFAPVFGLPKLTLLRLVSLLLAGIWISISLNKGVFQSSRSSLRLPLLAFFSLALLSSLYSVHPTTSAFGQYGRWEGLSTIACYFILYLSAYSIAGQRNLVRPLFTAILVSSMLVSVAAIIEHFWANPFLLIAKVYCAAGFGEPNAFEIGRSMATFGNATFLATYLALVLPIIYSYSFSNRQDVALRGLSYFALLLVSVALLLTFGRAAWIAAVAGIALVSWINRDFIVKYRARIAAVAAVLILSLTIAGSTGGNYSVLGRTASVFKIEGSTLTRIQMWDASLALIPESPLLGTGPDTFKYVFGKYKPGGWVEHFSDPLVDKAHSDALQIAVTHGVLGTVAYLWIFIVFLWSGAKKLRLLKGPQENWLTAGILGAVLGYAIQLQFNFSHFATAPYFWIFMGLACGHLFKDGTSKEIDIGALSYRRIPVFGVLTIALISLAILSITPLVADMHFARGREFQSLKKIPEALREYESATLFNGLEPIYKTSLAEVLIEYGVESKNDRYIDLGSTAFAEARRINPIDEQIYFRAGAAFLEAGRGGKPALLARSIEQHYQGLSLNPVMVDAYLDIGVAYAYLGNYDEAILAWSDALIIEPDNDRAYYNLGWAYEQKGEQMRAKEAYLKAYRLNPGMADAKAAYDRL